MVTRAIWHASSREENRVIGSRDKLPSIFFYVKQNLDGARVIANSDFQDYCTAVQPGQTPPSSSTDYISSAWKSTNEGTPGTCVAERPWVLAAIISERDSRSSPTTHRDQSGSEITQSLSSDDYSTPVGTTARRLGDRRGEFRAAPFLRVSAGANANT